MRVISGIYKRRRFDVPNSFKARPTTDFAKENLFNVLSNNYFDFEDGGSFSTEITLSQPRETNSMLILPVRADAFKFIEKCSEQFDFIFADPPYALKDLQSIPGRIFENGLLKENGLLVLEHGKDQNFEDDPHFIERRIYGSVNFSFFRATVPEAE